MSRNRFYIGQKEQDERLEEWLAGKIPNPPVGMICECDEDVHAHESEPDSEGNVEIVPCDQEATTYLYRIEDQHVCYTYVCETCGGNYDEEYLANYEYPQTSDGYAVTPKHCS